ncbi:hypothetical protein Cantr_01224 [Candida viswanathii]|uniref:Uncharacterized protein n=1 Tax=Candida viswanathii TaxID=5486 RepID=A0A367YHC8_9ASCO|nr:hypothetical protein Cantr_01224 [Candida viswanathii]
MANEDSDASSLWLTVVINGEEPGVSKVFFCKVVKLVFSTYIGAGDNGGVEMSTGNCSRMIAWKV